MTDLSTQLATDLEQLMPGCAVVAAAHGGAMYATACHKVTGRQLVVRVAADGWRVTCAGASTVGVSAYGCDSAVVHFYRHVLDFTSDHGPGTAYDYAQRATV